MRVQKEDVLEDDEIKWWSPIMQLRAAHDRDYWKYNYESSDEDEKEEENKEDREEESEENDEEEESEEEPGGGLRQHWEAMTWALNRTKIGEDQFHIVLVPLMI